MNKHFYYKHLKRCGEATHKKIVRLLSNLFEMAGCGWLSSVGLEHIDMQLVEILGQKRKGYFIEAGANDGVNQSNTYYLEKVMGWTGMLIEPLPHKALLCKRNRPKSVVHNLALTRTNGPSEVFVEDANLMSVVNDGTISPEALKYHVQIGRSIQKMDVADVRHCVPACPLEDLLSSCAITNVDFFSLDVEGYELEVLNGIDFSRVSFGAILIETRPNNEQEIDTLLVKNGYEWERIWKTRTYSNKLYFRSIPRPTAK